MCRALRPTVSAPAPLSFRSQEGWHRAHPCLRGIPHSLEPVSRSQVQGLLPLPHAHDSFGVNKSGRGSVLGPQRRCVGQTAFQNIPGLAQRNPSLTTGLLSSQSNGGGRCHLRWGWEGGRRGAGYASCSPTCYLRPPPSQGGCNTHRLQARSSWPPDGPATVSHQTSGSQPS